MRYLPIAMLILLLFISASSQESPPPTLKKCDHESTRMSRFKASGFFPIIARNYDGSRIEWTYSDDEGHYSGTLAVDKGTTLPPNFGASYKDRFFWAVYSDCDQYAY